MGHLHFHQDEHIHPEAKEYHHFMNPYAIMKEGAFPVQLAIPNMAEENELLNFSQTKKEHEPNNKDSFNRREDITPSLEPFKIE